MTHGGLAARVRQAASELGVALGLGPVGPGTLTVYVQGVPVVDILLAENGDIQDWQAGVIVSEDSAEALIVNLRVKMPEKADHGWDYVEPAEPTVPSVSSVY